MADEQYTLTVEIDTNGAEGVFILQALKDGTYTLELTSVDPGVDYIIKDINLVTNTTKTGDLPTFVVKFAAKASGERKYFIGHKGIDGNVKGGLLMKEFGFVYKVDRDGAPSIDANVTPWVTEGSPRAFGFRNAISATPLYWTREADDASEQTPPGDPKALSIFIPGKGKLKMPRARPSNFFVYWQNKLPAVPDENSEEPSTEDQSDPFKVQFKRTAVAGTSDLENSATIHYSGTGVFSES